jgi:hypothetical protein
MIINVRIGEFLNILCPKYIYDNDDPEYHSIYMVSKNEYNECNLKQKNKLLLKCDRPHDSLKYTLYISKFSPVPDAIEFVEGMDYYIMCKCNFSIFCFKILNNYVLNIN